MAEFLLQVLSLAVMVTGVFLGELLTWKTLGRHRPKYILLDALLFILVFASLFTLVAPERLGNLYYPVMLLAGMAVVVLTRAVEIGLGLTVAVQAASPRDAAAEIALALLRHGVDPEDAKRVIKDLGYSAKVVDKAMEETEAIVPPYLPKLVKMSADIDEIKDRINSLAAGIQEIRQLMKQPGKRSIVRVKGLKSRA